MIIVYACLNNIQEFEIYIGIPACILMKMNCPTSHGMQQQFYIYQKGHRDHDDFIFKMWN